jgi:D-sedoheptulose 7-phosphate isomerase
MSKIADYLEQMKQTTEQMKGQEKNIQNTINLLSKARKENGKVFICGNGGSAGTATHMTCDLFKIAGLRAICLNDNVPLMTAIINDNGWDNLFIDQLQRLFEKGDVLIAISVHGGVGKDKAGAWSQNLTKAIDYVNKNGGVTVGFSGFDGGAMKEICTVCITIPAESTPIVESYHVVVEHLIAFYLKQVDRV